jgi:hypothetical protein
MKITRTMNTPPILGSTKFRMLPKKLMTKARPKHHQKRLFIPVHAFEVLYFPVPVRSVESLGNGVCRSNVRLIRF